MSKTAMLPSCFSLIHPTPTFSIAHTSMVWQAFPDIGQALAINHTVLIAHVQQLFHVLYLFNPLATEHALVLAWLKTNNKTIITHFVKLVTHGCCINHLPDEVEIGFLHSTYLS